VKEFSDGVATEMTKLLQQYIVDGLGTRANYGCSNSGGKTGTTNNNTDAWFVGFTDHLSTSVWIGYPKGSISMGSYIEGPTLPAEIWHNYMEQATAGDCASFPNPDATMTYTPFVGRYTAGSSASTGPANGTSTTGTPTYNYPTYGYGGQSAPTGAGQNSQSTSGAGNGSAGNGSAGNGSAGTGGGGNGGAAVPPG
jgi:membrane peptidoglycan carboxypeptidase